jgi:hypothetical protein
MGQRPGYWLNCLKRRARALADEESETQQAAQEVLLFVGLSSGQILDESGGFI